MISKFSFKRNGRDTYNTLKLHFEGIFYFDLMLSQANTKMTKYSYQGDKVKFKWEDLFTMHMKDRVLYE